MFKNEFNPEKLTGKGKAEAPRPTASELSEEAVDAARRASKNKKAVREDPNELVVINVSVTRKQLKDMGGVKEASRQSYSWQIRQALDLWLPKFVSATNETQPNGSEE